MDYPAFLIALQLQKEPRDALNFSCGEQGESQDKEMLLGALAQESQGTWAINLSTRSSFLFKTNVNTHTRTSYREKTEQRIFSNENQKLLVHPSNGWFCPKAQGTVPH